MIAFGTLVQHVLSLDSSIEWVALEEPGREPRWAWRDAKSCALCAGAAGDVHIADPLLFWLAEGGGDLADEQHPVRFIVLAYDDVVQIVARLQPGAHVTVAASPGVDPYALGRKLTSLLDNCAQRVLD
jgi:hypothetical protein